MCISSVVQLTWVGLQVSWTVQAAPRLFIPGDKLKGQWLHKACSPHSGGWGSEGRAELCNVDTAPIIAALISLAKEVSQGNGVREWGGMSRLPTLEWSTAKSPGLEHGWKPYYKEERRILNDNPVHHRDGLLLKHVVEFILGLVLRTLFTTSFSVSTTGEISLWSTSGKWLFSFYRHSALCTGCWELSAHF